MADSQCAQIPQFFAGRSVFITGATGFMGKVLVERLLSTCPDIGELFLLVRTKRDALPEKRLNELKQSVVFNVVRQTSPGQLAKLRLVSGDIAQPELGISSEDVEQLREVSVVFHAAASVRFAEPLARAVRLNALAVRHALALADRLPRLVSFVHVSTAFCNAEHERIEERVYELPRPLDSMLADTLAVPDDAAHDVVMRFISPKPNAYTFTKALGEAALAQHTARYPRAIFRPTIVVSSLRHPFPGWMEGHNGPAGVVLAISSGLLQVFPARGTARCDLLPVDLAIDTLIACAWETAQDKSASVRVYNCSTGSNATTWAALRSAAERLARAHPPCGAGAYPACLLTHNRLLYPVLKCVLQTAPLHLAEYVTRALNYNKKNRPNLLKTASRLNAMSEALRHFATREWRFSTAHVRALRARLAPADAAVYNLDPGSIVWEQFHREFARGCREHVARVEEDSPRALTTLRRWHYAQRAVTILLPLLLIHHIIILFQCKI